VDSLYFGQTPPGDSAIIFAPDFISLPGRFNQNATFSPDGKEFCFTISNSGWNISNIWYTKFENGKWSTPQIAPFNQTNDIWDPFFTPDGKSLLYCHSGVIWMLNKEQNSWSGPVALISPVNPGSSVWSPSVTSDGTIYFFSTDDLHIHYAKKKDGAYSNIEKLQSPINDYNDVEPYIAPDESYLIFCSDNRPDGLGQSDLYISFKTNSGWTSPKNLGPKINSGEIELTHKMTPDNKYLLFMRRAQPQTNKPSMIYWVKADFIDSLKHTNFTPNLKSVIPNQRDTTGHLFNFQIPDSTFIDDNGNNTLTYNALLNNEKYLPGWLSFNSATRTFSGVPDTTEIDSIKITATNTAGASVSTQFTITVASPSIDYFGQTLPGDSTIIFAP
jgi:hypothetical protein